jgi:dCMP deaminase
MNNHRPSWNIICMNLAKEIAKRSTCSNPNRKVGCVIVDDSYERILAWGYNGVASGEDHKCEWGERTMDKEYNSCSCCHAEMNCLVKLDATDPSGKIMYITLAPCMICARLIVNAKRIHTVYFNEFYKDRRSLELLERSGIQTYLLPM